MKPVSRTLAPLAVTLIAVLLAGCDLAWRWNQALATPQPTDVPVTVVGIEGDLQTLPADVSADTLAQSTSIPRDMLLSGTHDGVIISRDLLYEAQDDEALRAELIAFIDSGGVLIVWGGASTDFAEALETVRVITGSPTGGDRLVYSAVTRQDGNYKALDRLVEGGTLPRPYSYFLITVRTIRNGDQGLELPRSP